MSDSSQAQPPGAETSNPPKWKPPGGSFLDRFFLLIDFLIPLVCFYVVVPLGLSFVPYLRPFLLSFLLYFGLILGFSVVAFSAGIFYAVRGLPRMTERWRDFYTSICFLLFVLNALSVYLSESYNATQWENAFFSIFMVVVIAVFTGTLFSLHLHLESHAKGVDLLRSPAMTKVSESDKKESYKK